LVFNSLFGFIKVHIGGYFTTVGGVPGTRGVAKW